MVEELLSDLGLQKLCEYVACEAGSVEGAITGIDPMSLVVLLGIGLGVIFVASIPFYIALRLLGSDASLLTVFFASVIVGILEFVLLVALPESALLSLIVSFILPLIIYSRMFGLGLLRTFTAYILQFIILAVLVLLIPVLLGGIGLAIL